MFTITQSQIGKTSIYLLLIAAFLMIQNAAHAKTRSCDAGYVATNRADGAQFVFGEFVARGNCGRDGDECRKKARSLASNCMKAHWRDRWDRRMPSECRSGNIERYNVEDFKKTLETEACHRGWGRNGTVTLRVAGHSKGQNKTCSSRTELTSSYEITEQMCDAIVSKPSTPPSTRSPKALVIQPNNKRDQVSGLMFPSSMPPIRYPKGYKGCTNSDKTKIQKAWAMAHYMVWTADNAMNWMKRNGQYRKPAWDYTFRNPASHGHINYAPRAWFGPVNNESFGEASGVIDKLWNKRYRGKTFTVSCRVKGNSGAHPCFMSNPGGKGRPSANHIVYGRINFCKSFFNNNKDHFDRARTVIHETLHWLTSPRGHALRDTHTHCHGPARCTTDKAYGREKSHHLSNYDGGNRGTAKSQKKRRVNHRKSALRNNDNYAWFTHDIGRAAYTKNWPSGLPALTHFPAPGFTW